MAQAAELRQRFLGHFGHEPRIYRAPGRVNLIGEHTDYNEGFVMPAAIDFYTWAAVAPRKDRRLRILSENFSESMEFDLDEMNPRARHNWSDYVTGMALTLERAGCRLRGADLLIYGEVPIGAGLSSSAAIEVASGYALLANSGLSVDTVELARLCQRAENEFVGTRCGIMDQFISCCGRAGHALMLDCRSLDYRLLPLAGDVKMVICNSMVRHELASGEYNTRRAECEMGMRLLAEHLPGARSLRDVTLDELEQQGRNLPDIIYRRCRHVVTENARVLEAAAALERENIELFGRLMGESHRSLRDDYEVSCRELDILVGLAGSTDRVYGARMTGGGFGGCTINLVSAENVEQFSAAVARQYERITGTRPEIYVSLAAEGAGPATVS
jgi:galactokinase